MKKGIYTGMLAGLLVFSECVSLMGGAATVQAAGEADNYEMDGFIADYDGYDELCVGNTVTSYADLFDRNGNKLTFEEEWRFLDDDELAVTIKTPMFYSAYDSEDIAMRDMKSFSGDIPGKAFGQYIYAWIGVQLVSDPGVIVTKLARSRYKVTAWGETEKQTYALNSDGRTVRVFSVWDLDNDLDAVFEKNINVDGKQYKVTGIGNNILEDGALDMRSVTIYSGIKSIDEDAFKGAGNLKNVTIQGDVTSIGKRAFADINKKAVFKIKASKANYKKIVKRIKNSGVAKTVKFKRVK